MSIQVLSLLRFDDVHVSTMCNSCCVWVYHVYQLLCMCLPCVPIAVHLGTHYTYGTTCLSHHYYRFPGCDLGPGQRRRGRAAPSAHGRRVQRHPPLHPADQPPSTPPTKALTFGAADLRLFYV